MTNINEMTDLEISDRLAELDPMEYNLCADLRRERYSLLWERFRRNRADSQEYWANWRDLGEMDTSGSYSYELPS